MTPVSWRNAAWSTADHVVLLVVSLASTPVLLHHLGLEQYGIWILVNSVAGAFGVMNLGLGDATVKFVSSYRALGDEDAVRAIVRNTLSMYCSLGILTGLALCLIAPVLTSHAFRIPASSVALSVDALRLGGALLALRFVDTVFLSVLRGLQRFDIPARVGIVVKTLTQLSAVALAVVGYSIRPILAAACVILVLGTTVQVLAVRRLVVGLPLLPAFNVKWIREVLSFGMWSWAQVVAGTVFAQSDRLIVGAFLGPSVLAYYSVCLQLAQQIHLLPSAAGSFLFPLVSELHARASDRLFELYLFASRLIMIASGGAAVGLILFAKPLLELWLGASVAHEAAPILRALSVSYAVFAANTIAPFYFMNGANQVREQGIISLGSGALATVVAFPLLSFFGVVGVAYCRAFDAVLRVFARSYVHRKLFGVRSLRLSMDGVAVVGGVSLVALLAQPSLAAVFRTGLGLGDGAVKVFVALGGLGLALASGALVVHLAAKAYHSWLISGPIPN